MFHARVRNPFRVADEEPLTRVRILPYLRPLAISAVVKLADSIYGDAVVVGMNTHFNLLFDDAASRPRTHDVLITGQALYRLSYGSTEHNLIIQRRKLRVQP